jgi:type II secretory pathway pseudopilin PulG
MRHFFLKTKRSFTLIELTIVIFILAILVVVLAPTLSQGIESWLTIRDQEIILSRARLALDRILEETRFSCSTLNAAASDQLDFNDPDANRVVFSTFSSTFLRRGTPDETGSAILARNVASFTLTYQVFDSTIPGLRNFNPGSDPLTAIRYIRIRIIFNSETFPGRQYVFESGVTPRYFPWRFNP